MENRSGKERLKWCNNIIQVIYSWLPRITVINVIMILLSRNKFINTAEQNKA